jgi:glycosyltransferase involved in cell wall biosynthesis
MIDVAALTDLNNTPSSRFRIRSLITPLERRGVAVTDLKRKFSTEMSALQFPKTRIRRDPRKAALAATYHLGDLGQTLVRVMATRRFSATWVSREVIIGHTSWEGLIKQPFYYDIDDAVFLRSSFARAGIDRLIRNAACVFAGNEFLADYCSTLTDKIEVVPTAVDTARFHPDPDWQPSAVFKVVWSGTSSSFPYLKAIEEQLAAFFRAAPDARFHIYSTCYPQELTALREFIHYEQWSAQAEVAQIQDADVGLMPIPDTDWARGKCSYKMLLYAACGVPCVVSDVGMNIKVLAQGRVGIGCSAPDDWRSALEEAYRQRNRLRHLFPDGPAVVQRFYSVDVVADKIVRTMVGKGNVTPKTNA